MSSKSGKIALLLFLCFASLYVLTAGGHFYNQDGYMKYLTLDQMAKGQGPFHPRLGTPGRDGNMTTSFPPGTCLWMLPLYELGNVVLKAVQIFRPDDIIDTQLFFAPLFVTFLNAFSTAGVIALFFLTAYRLTADGGKSLLACGLLGLGSILWPYSKFCYSEPQAAFFLLAAFYFLLRYKQCGALPDAVWAGTCFAAAFITKYEVAYLFPAFALYCFYAQSQPRVHSLSGLLFLTPVFLGVCVFFAWNQLRFGVWLETGRYAGYLWDNPLPLMMCALAALSAAALYFSARVRTGLKNVLQKRGWELFAFSGLAAVYAFSHPAAMAEARALLVAPGKSVFIFSPVLFLSVLGWSHFYKSHRAEAVFSLSLPFLFFYFLPYTLPSTAWQWGSRFFLTLTPFLFLPALGFVCTPAAAWRKRLLTMGVFILGAAVQIPAVSVNYPDAFNYASQRISAETHTHLTAFWLERQKVFPRLIYDIHYAPLVLNTEILMAVISGRRPEEPVENLPFKTNVKRPSQWDLDFWWRYLRHFPGAYSSTIVMAWILLALFMAGLLGLKQTSRSGEAG